MDNVFDLMVKESVVLCNGRRTFAGIPVVDSKPKAARPFKAQGSMQITFVWTT